MASIIEALRYLPDNQKLIHKLVKFIKPRGDDTINIDTEVGRSEFKEKILGENITSFNPDPHYSCTTDTASPHNEYLVEHPDNPEIQTSSHFTTWFFHLSYESIVNVPKEAFHEIASAFTKSVIYLIDKTKVNPLLFQVFGYTSKDYPDGKGKGAASNNLLHLHATRITSDDLTEPTELTPAEMMKYYSPISSVIESEWIELISQLTTESKDLPPIIVNPIEYKNNPNLPTVNLKLTDSTNVADYLEVLYKLNDKFNYIYQSLMSSYEDIHCSEAEHHQDIKIKFTENMTNLGINQELSDKLFDKGKLFQPTLRQVRNWLNKNDLAPEPKEKLDNLLKHHLASKKHYSDPLTKARFKRLKHGDILLKIKQDQFIDKDEDRTPLYTLAQNFPWKITCEQDQYSSDGKRLIINDVNLSPLLFNDGNSSENAARTKYGGIIIHRR